MEISSLKELYSKVRTKTSIVFVVPLIRHSFPGTDYLYMLYKNLLEKPSGIAIESISVFAHIKMVFKALTNRNTILHYHWLEFQDFKSLLAMPYKLKCIWLYNLFGGKIIWTIHNLNPHDKKYISLHRRIHKWMAKKATVLHVHSLSSVEIVSKTYEVSKEKIVILKHPFFPSEILDKKEAQQKFLAAYGEGKPALTDLTFLIFGGISEYKGIREIIDILISKKEPFHLIIAGYVKKGQEPLHDFILQKSKEDDRILYIPTFIPENHYPFLLSSADVCLFNYDEILTSGGIEMALAYQRDIIAPAKGGIIDVENTHISLFESKVELDDLLQHKLSDVKNV